MGSIEDYVSKLAYETYMQALHGVGNVALDWQSLGEKEQQAWRIAISEVVYETLRKGDSERVALRIPPLYTPTFDIMGTLHTAKHLILITDKEKESLTQFANRYEDISRSGEPPTPEQELAMYQDMGKLLRMFLPTLTPGELALLGRGDRYRLIVECFSASERMREEMQERNAGVLGTTPEMEVAAAAGPMPDPLPDVDVP